MQTRFYSSNHRFFSKLNQVQVENYCFFIFRYKDIRIILSLLLKVETTNVQ